jgi:DNA-binding IclR family transcriptional regulator
LAVPTGSQSVERAADLLVRILDSDHAPSVGELAAGAELPKSTTSRLLRALESRGLVQREGTRGNLRAGPAVLRFARRAGGGQDLVALTAPALDELAERTGETVNLAVAGPDGVEHLAQRDSRYFLGSTNWVGRTVPFHAAANGKVLLAFGAARLPRGELERFTPQTITDRTKLEAELEEVRRSGYATAVDELEPGLLAVAAPVTDGDGRIVAALSVSAPTARCSEDEANELGLLLRSVAERALEGGRRDDPDSAPHRQR